MPERSFGRTVRYRRTKLGLSQAKLGELVGRSASTIRSWERDKSSPTEAGVLHTLAAILGVDERSLFEKAGQEMPDQYETSPTVEEALASLRPADDDGSHPEMDETDLIVTIEDEDADETPPSQSGLSDDEGPEQEPVSRPGPVGQPDEARLPLDSRPGYVKPRDPFVVTPATPPFVEPSYMEDSNQRQLYRVRNLATLVVAVALVIALIWALSESLGALGDWWDDFFGSLRL